MEEVSRVRLWTPIAVFAMLMPVYVWLSSWLGLARWPWTFGDTDRVFADRIFDAVWKDSVAANVAFVLATVVVAAVLAYVIHTLVWLHPPVWRKAAWVPTAAFVANWAVYLGSFSLLSKDVNPAADGGLFDFAAVDAISFVREWGSIGLVFCTCFMLLWLLALAVVRTPGALRLNPIAGRPVVEGVVLLSLAWVAAMASFGWHEPHCSADEVRCIGVETFGTDGARMLGVYVTPFVAAAALFLKDEAARKGLVLAASNTTFAMLLLGLPLYADQFADLHVIYWASLGITGTMSVLTMMSFADEEQPTGVPA